MEPSFLFHYLGGKCREKSPLGNCCFSGLAVKYATSVTYCTVRDGTLFIFIAWEEKGENVLHRWMCCPVWPPNHIWAFTVNAQAFPVSGHPYASFLRAHNQTRRSLARRANTLVRNAG